MDGLILAGDVGGTKTHLGLFKHSAGTLDLVRDHRYATADFASLEAVCANFLGASTATLLGLPGVSLAQQQRPSEPHVGSEPATRAPSQPTCSTETSS